MASWSLPLYESPYEDKWHIVRPDALQALYDTELRRRLSWYYSVLSGENPPKYRIALGIEAPLTPEELREADERDLWRVHERLADEARRLYRRAREGSTIDVERARVSLLHVKAELARRLASPCRLCERLCMVERASGRIGACRLAWDVYVHSALLHLGEEAPLVPSGTIFYGGCNFTCVFCQNYDVSQTMARRGYKATPRTLALLQDALAARGARNINHVGGDPTPSMHVIVESMLYTSHSKPQLWNSNMYMTREAMEILVDLVDIWLPDFKYWDPQCARRLSGVKRYREVVERNIRVAAEHGDIIIRHLVMPGHMDCCSLPIIRWIASSLPRDRVVVNVMGQYRPEHHVARNPKAPKWRDIARRPTREEVDRVVEEAERLGLYLLP
ncbi:MAG: radical SAM protein [Desulfurococcales archaeon]|nr:radical SAM protein [Desulfurococcales archaeon]